MKKILALTLALIMILGLATTASAATANVTVEKTGHTYQRKNQEVADDILHQLQEWRTQRIPRTSNLRQS